MANTKNKLKQKNRNKKSDKIQSKSLNFSNSTLLFWIGGVVLITFVLYFPVLSFDFVNWDDDRYVLDNAYLELNWTNIKYYFSNFYFLMYLPITLLTYAIDYKIGDGPAPDVFHTTSLIFHLCNSALVFLFSRKVFELLKIKTKDIAAFAVAVMFGIVPMHIESAAWIAERKDVVYTFFYLLSLITYINYIKKPRMTLYLATIVFFLLSIISKAQAMTLPIILILVDYLFQKNYLNKKFLLQKIPFFIISIIFGVIAILGTRSEGASANTAYSWIEKFVYASYGYITYIVKIFAPYKLSVIYPYPEAVNHAIPLVYWLYLIPSFIIVATMVWFYRKSKIITFGIAFFSINIIIVLQVFAYHNFIMADRYSYVSSIGLLILVVWLLSVLIEKFKKIKIPVYVLFAIYIIFLFWYSHNRLFDWKDSVTLWADVKSKYPEVVISYYNGANAKAEIADAFMAKGDNRKAKAHYDDALIDYDKAIEMNPKYVGALSNRGITHAKIGMVKESLKDFDRVVAIDSLYNNVYSNRGNAKAMLGNKQGALQDYNRAISINPKYTDALFNRGMVYTGINEWEKGYQDFNRVIQINSNYSNAYYYRGMCASNIKRYKDAINDFNFALKINQNNLDAWYNRGVTYILMENYNAAIKDLDVVIRTNPNIGIAYYQRGMANALSGNKTKGCADLEKSFKMGVKEAIPQLNKFCK